MTKTGAVRALRSFAEASVGERCDLCKGPVSAQHAHRFLPGERALECICDKCASRRPEGSPWQIVAHKVALLAGFEMSDDEWVALGLPVRLAFFVKRAHDGATQVFFPSAAGATESPLDPERWARLERKSPLLANMDPEVDALLLHHVGEARVSLLVSIDVCYELAGILRVHWRGFSGGTEAWRELEGVMRHLTDEAIESRPSGGAVHA